MADPTAEEQALAAELDELLSQSRGRSAPTDQARADGGGGAQTPPTIEELDELLADSTPNDLDLRAEDELAQAQAALSESSLSEGSGHDSDPEPVVAPTDVMPEADVPDEAPLPVESETASPPAPDPEPEVNPEARASEPSPDIAAEPAPQPDRDTEIDLRTETREEFIIGGESQSAPDPAPARFDLAQMTLAVLRVISAPLVLAPPHVREIIGWLALVTAFNALCIWAYLLFLH